MVFDLRSDSHEFYLYVSSMKIFTLYMWSNINRILLNIFAPGNPATSPVRPGYLLCQLPEPLLSCDYSKINWTGLNYNFRVIWVGRALFDYIFFIDSILTTQLWFD
jgi:hypothetical protein